MQRWLEDEALIWDTDDNFRQEGIVMGYRQIGAEERYTLAALRTQHPRLSNREIARRMGRHPSTIGREVKRNAARHDGAYRPSKAQERTNGRRSRTRRWSKITAKQWMLVENLLVEGLSPEQISGRLRREGTLRISHETIYKYVWSEKHAGGSLHMCLRQRTKKHRKRYATRERRGRRRGRLPGKRHIDERPEVVGRRRQIGHWEVDTVHGSGRDSVATFVERVTGLVLIGKLRNVTAAELNKRALKMIRRFERKYGPISRLPPRTTAQSFTAMPSWNGRRASSSTSQRHTIRGSVARTRTRTG